MNIYTSIPLASVSKEILIRSNVNTVNKIEEYLVCIEKNLNKDLEFIKSSMKKIKITEKLHPSIFFYQYEMQVSVQNGVVNDVNVALDKLHCALISNNKISEIKVDSILTEGWEVNYVEHLKKYDQKDICGNSAVIEPIKSEDELSFHQENIQKSLSLIKEFSPEIFDEIEKFVTHIKIFTGEVLRGDTSARTLGAMWLRIPEPEDDQVGYWIEHIVHEVSHIRLEHLFLLEKLVLNSSGEKIFKAPIRDDLRPMKGIFHASFVLSRMIRVFYLLSTKAKMHKRFRDRLQLCKLQYDIGQESLKHPKAKFNKNGMNIIETLNETACYKFL